MRDLYNSKVKLECWIIDNMCHISYLWVLKVLSFIL
jgi:hypothetical protein